MKLRFTPLLLLLFTLVGTLALGQPQSEQSPAQEQTPVQQMPQQQQMLNGAPAAGGGFDHAQSPQEAGVDIRPERLVVDGRKGWKIRLEGNHPLATPAFVDGRVYLGGGFGSHEFYCLDAASGELVWVYRTGDDGPTAAVYQDGCIAFNTESCELEVLTPEGKRLWKSWLGDPLMSMPAIHEGRVYMAYPDSRGDRRHYLACFDVKTGKAVWKQAIAGEIITTPVVEGGKVYLATLEGILYCFEAESGKLVWEEKRNATSSVSVWKGRCLYSQRDETGDPGKRQQSEQLARMDSVSREGAAYRKTVRKADYLDYGRKQGSRAEDYNQSLDATVGFATSKGDAKIGQARANLGEGSVYGVWSYQGGRPFVWQGRMLSSLGDELTCVDVETGDVQWKQRFTREPESTVDRTLTPPAIVKGKAFLGTSYGDVLCLDVATGKELWKAHLKDEVIRFQPVVARGRVYVATNSGTLYCIETGTAADDGWYMWGGNAEHTGRL